MNIFTILNLLEDLIALNNKDYINSIQKARNEYKNGDVFFHDEVFGER
ncbi:MAG: hypothetical protein O3B87_05650 [bacterium]|nr:hypothetical protein [bacterium]